MFTPCLPEAFPASVLKSSPSSIPGDTQVALRRSYGGGIAPAATYRLRVMVAAAWRDQQTSSTPQRFRQRKQRHSRPENDAQRLPLTPIQFKTQHCATKLLLARGNFMPLIFRQRRRCTFHHRWFADISQSPAPRCASSIRGTRVRKPRSSR